MVEFIKAEFGDNEYAIRIGKHFVADIYPKKGRRPRAALFDRAIEHRFGAEELRAIADKLDQLNGASNGKN